MSNINTIEKLIQLYESHDEILTERLWRSFQFRIHYFMSGRMGLQTDTLFDLHTHLRFIYQRARYRYPVSPWEVIHVNPRFVSEAVPFAVTLGLGQIVGGGWDQIKDTSIRKVRSTTVNGLYQRFVLHYEWKDTVYVKDRIENKSGNIKVSGYRSINEFINIRCAYLDELFFDIKKNGYTPNYKKGHRIPRQDSAANEAISHSRYEPLVAISRNGEIMWVSGFHRYTIARILEINKIPVNVVVRHREWVSKRQKIIENKLAINNGPSKYCNHPDVEYYNPS